MSKSIAFVWCILALGHHASAGFYDGYKVYKVTPRTEEQAMELDTWKQVPGIDFWSESRMLDEPCDIMVSPDKQGEFESLLEFGDFAWKIASDDVEGVIEKFEQTRRNRAVPRQGQFSFDDYQRHQVMNDYLDHLAKTYPNYVTVKDEGKSFEKRVIKSILITDGTQSKDKVTMLIDCGIHAREWIAPTFCMYLVQQLVEKREQHSDMLRNINWYIVPLLNPDGYEFTHEGQRLWRKTRQPSSTQPECIGVDGNRNYGHEWGGAGTSDEPCSDVYKGPKAFSEPETKMMGDLITAVSAANRGRVGYLTFHSYGYWFLYPWGHSQTAQEPPFAYKIKKAAQNALNAVHRHSGGIYKAGNSAQLLYPAAGGSDDYAMGAAGIELALTVELPPRSRGFAGFLLPPDQIRRVCNETMAAVREFGYFLADNYLV